jgi:hypothetical protein
MKLRVADRFGSAKAGEHKVDNVNKPTQAAKKQKIGHTHRDIEKKKKPARR